MAFRAWLFARSRRSLRRSFLHPGCGRIAAGRVDRPCVFVRPGRVDGPCVFVRPGDGVSEVSTLAVVDAAAAANIHAPGFVWTRSHMFLKNVSFFIVSYFRSFTMSFLGLHFFFFVPSSFLALSEFGDSCFSVSEDVQPVFHSPPSPVCSPSPCELPPGRAAPRRRPGPRRCPRILRLSPRAVL